MTAHNTSSKWKCRLLLILGKRVQQIASPPFALRSHSCLTVAVVEEEDEKNEEWQPTFLTEECLPADGTALQSLAIPVTGTNT
jgi:hypothetical protein